jgi:hypothetical protein
MFFQHKDSPMLLLESDRPSGTRHAWDAPHPDLDPSDEADRMNCALASTSMVNAYFAGVTGSEPHLTQDRIGFEVFARDSPGAELDLNYGGGLKDGQITAALTFALGAPPVYRPWLDDAAIILLNRTNIYTASDYVNGFWRDLLASIAADKPVTLSVLTGAFTSGKHNIVAAGAFLIDGVPYVRTNDPWYGKVSVPLASLRIVAYWLLPDAPAPRADEPELRERRDTDRDGVMDFDEQRLGTRYVSPDTDRDTDGDCVEDLAEVRASVFDDRHGWGQYVTKTKRGLPVLSDGALRLKSPRPELDGISTDSDGGGVPDSMEDLNLDGRHQPEQGETNPFIREDDGRTIDGYHLLFRDFLDSGGSGGHTTFDMRVDMHLAVTPEGTIAGTGDVRHTYRIQYDDLPPYPNCNVGHRTRVLALPQPFTYQLALKAHFVCQTLFVEPDPFTQYPPQPITITDSCEPTSTGTVGLPAFGGLTAGPPTIDGAGKAVYRSISAVRTGPATHFDHDVTVTR